MTRWLCTFFLLAGVTAGAATNGVVASTNFCFPVGEKLVYRLYWGVIPVGAAEMTAEWGEEDGKQYLVLRATARTTSVVAKIYPVNDVIESVVDPETLLPVKYVQRLHEGRHVRDDDVLFFHEDKVARWECPSKGERRDIPIAGDTRDVLCLAYVLRCKGFGSGEKAKYRVFVDNKLYDLELAGVGTDEVSVDGIGKVRCLEVEPKAKFGEIFVRKGKVGLWFSEDARRICTKMVGKVPVANVKAILTGVEGPGEDFWARPELLKKE